MHEKIENKVMGSLDEIRSALQGQDDSDNKYRQVVKCLTRTFPFKEDKSDFLIYPAAYKIIADILDVQISEELSTAMSDISGLLAGTNIAYDEVESKLLGASPQQEVYDYLVNQDD